MDREIERGEGIQRDREGKGRRGKEWEGKEKNRTIFFTTKKKYDP